MSLVQTSCPYFSGLLSVVESVILPKLLNEEKKIKMFSQK